MVDLDALSPASKVLGKFERDATAADGQAVPEADKMYRLYNTQSKSLSEAFYVASVAKKDLGLGTNRPDVSAYVNGVPVAIEIQISFLSQETIMRRTIEYARKGIYVLWLLLWTPDLDRPRYNPAIWEKWIHAAYFGRVYYWREGLSIISYNFEPTLKSIPKTTWYSTSGRKMTGGGYTRRMKRHRTAIRGDTLNLATDFVPQERYWWEGNGIKVPDAKLFIHRGGSKNLRS